MRRFTVRVPIERWSVQVAIYPAGSATEFEAAVAQLPADVRFEFPRTASRIDLANGQTQILHAAQTVNCTIGRDLLEGKWHSIPRPIEAEGETLALKATFEPPAESKPDSAMVQAVAGALNHSIFGTRRSLVPRIRILQAARIATDEATILCAWHETDRQRQAVPERPSSLADVALRTTDLLPVVIREEGQTFVPAPEVEALVTIKALGAMLKENLPTPEVRRAAQAAAGAIHAVANSHVPRAFGVRGHFGTEEQQWGAIQDLARTSTNLLIVSSFLNARFADEYAHRLAKANPLLELTILAGHADERPISEHTKEAAAFQEALQKHVPKTRVVLSTRRTHLKVALSNTGHAWLGSCNLFSCAPGSDVFESGITLGPGPASAQLWAETQAHTPSQATLPSPPLPGSLELSQDTRRALASLVETLRNGQVTPELIDQAQRQLLAVSEAPQVHVVRTAETRNAMLSLASSARNRILLATDRIRPAGLDPQLTNLLENQPYAGPRSGRFTFQVIWGRDDPNAPTDVDAVATGRQLFGKLRFPIVKRAREEKRKQEGVARQANRRFDVWFLPLNDLGPFMNHAKAFAVDDSRLLLTSDNLLVYGSQRGDDDSTELGLLVDSPRLARMLRGELELAIPAAGDRWDYTKWYVALATAVEDSAQPATLGPCIAAVIDRSRRVGGTEAFAEALGQANDTGVAEFLGRAISKGIIEAKWPATGTGDALFTCPIGLPGTGAWQRQKGPPTN